LTWVCAGQL